MLVLYKRVMELVSPSHFADDFSRKIFPILYSINWPNLIVWLPLLIEILGNMNIIMIFRWNRKHFSSFLIVFQLPEIASDWELTFKYQKYCWIRNHLFSQYLFRQKKFFDIFQYPHDDLVFHRYCYSTLYFMIKISMKFVILYVRFWKQYREGHCKSKCIVTFKNLSRHKSCSNGTFEKYFLEKLRCW